MTQYLVFRLYGPMASWGQPAVGESRPTSSYPTRSAILGLLGAACGIKRDEESRLMQLQQGIRIAVKQVIGGSLMRDYHTTQVPSASKKVEHLTRKSELSESELNTILSSRDYRMDGLWVIAISLTEQNSLDLQQLKSALLQPVYAPYLGRKACPLALPMLPQLVETETLKLALDTSFPAMTHSDEFDHYWLGQSRSVSYFWEGNKSDIEVMGGHILTTMPWDEPRSRLRWQFAPRTLYQLSVKD